MALSDEEYLQAIEANYSHTDELSSISFFTNFGNSLVVEPHGLTAVHVPNAKDCRYEAPENQKIVALSWIESILVDAVFHPLEGFGGEIQDGVAETLDTIKISKVHDVNGNQWKIGDTYSSLLGIENTGLGWKTVVAGVEEQGSFTSDKEAATNYDAIIQKSDLQAKLNFPQRQFRHEEREAEPTNGSSLCQNWKVQCPFVLQSSDHIPSKTRKPFRS
jgi:hypothetical protein